MTEVELIQLYDRGECPPAVAADWLEQRGDARAAAFRWLVAEGELQLAACSASPGCATACTG